MKRDVAREIAVQLMFANKFNLIDLDNFLSEDYLSSLSEFNSLYSDKIDSKSVDYIKSVISKYYENATYIDGLISNNSNNWDINRLSGTALACLKCALTEMIYCDDIPTAATINSIVDIAKKYDDSKTVSFINGVLGSISKSLNDDE